jgi:hypothetical protein
MLDDVLGHRRWTMIEFDKTTDAASGAYGRPIVVTAKMDKQITGKKGFPYLLSFSTHHALTQQLRMKSDIVLLKQIEVGTFVLVRFALQQVPVGTLRADCGHAGKLRKYRKFRQAVALLRADK